MGKLKYWLLVSLSAFSALLTSLTFLQFMNFLSDFSTINSYSTSQFTKLGNITHFEGISDGIAYATQATIINISLLCIFIIQHSSLLSLQDIIPTVLKFPVLNRSLINVCTAAALQLLMYYWKPIPQYLIWDFNSNEESKQLVFIAIHFVSWLLIYVMMIAMDITDLLGIKQVYYYVTGRPAPSTLKSQQLNNLHCKVRHPSFLGFIIIFWIYPYMRLDRLLLATIMSLYMLLVWRPDVSDYNYVVQQQIAKKSAL